MFTITGTTGDTVYYSGAATGKKVLVDGEATVTVSSPAVGTVKLNLDKVTNTNSCVNTLTGVSDSVTVNALPDDADLDADSPICFGEDAVFTITGTTGDTVYYSGAATGKKVLVDGEATVTVSSPAVGTVKLNLDKVTNTNSCVNTLTGVSDSVTVNALPDDADLEADSPICFGEDAVFTITGTTGDTVYYSGAATGKKVLVDGEATVTVSSPAVGTVKLNLDKVTNTNSCVNPLTGISDSVTVNELPKPKITGNQEICDGDELTLSADGDVGSSFQWKLNGNTDGTGTTYTSSTLADGDVLKLIETNSNGCIDSTQVTITSNEKPEILDFDIVCIGGNLSSVKVIATIGTGTLEFKVDNGSWQTDSVLSSLSVGTHTFYVRESSTLCEVNSGEQSIQCDCPDVSTNSISAAQTICYNTAPDQLTGTVVTLTPATTTPTYQWQSSPVGAGNWSNVATTKDYSPAALTASTDYRRLVKVTGCPDDISNTITITVINTATVNTVDDLKFCADDNTGNINFTGNADSFHWTNDNTAIGLAASGTGNIASFIATNTTDTTISATITVTPRNSDNSVDCDGTPETFTITVNPTYTAEENTTVFDTICESDLEAFLYEGKEYSNANGAGSFSQDFTFQTLNGCDSIVTVNLTVNPTYTTDETANVDTTICEADLPFTYADSTFDAAGSKDIVFNTALGCDSIVTVNLTVNESTFETINVTECDQFTINDSTYTKTGQYIQYLENATGCDSTLTINLIINESSEQTLNVTACDSYVLNGITYTSSGTYIQNQTTQSGCELTITLNLNILSEDPVEIVNEASDLIVECDGQGNTEDLENWLQTIGTTGAAEAGFGTISWINDFESLTLACCNTGSATVTFTAADACGNTVSTTATFTIIDTDAPTFSAPEDITIYSGEECQYDASVEVTGDVTSESDVCCAELDATYTDEVEQGSCAGEWVITRTWNLADACGNQAEPQVQIITVMDTVAPTAVCTDVTIQLDENGLASINAEDLNGGSTDNCGIDTIFISRYDFTCDNVGTNDVTLTVVDNCGNTSTCTASVTVESGAANCGNVEAESDVLDIVVCKDREVSGGLNILENDNLNGGGFTLSATNLPEGVQLDLATGDLSYNSETITATTIQFTYTVCHDIYTNDCSEALVTINILIDTDCDGVPDVIDIDDDGDGILDVDEESYALNQETLDSDGDGIVDRLDIDSDNDGIPDNIEWQQNIAEGILYGSYDYGSDEGYDYFAPLGSDENGDGWDDRYDRDGIYYPPVDMDGDGTPDYLDEDSDGDGIADWIEGWDAAPHDTIADTDFIGTDADGDGLDDAYDSYDTNEEWLHGLNAIGSYAPLQDMAADTANNIRDWRDVIESPEDPNDRPQATTIFIPNGFSPNGDTYNDYFQIVMKDDAGTIFDIFGETFPDAKIEIYNRWGNLIYEKSNYGNYTEWGTTEAWWSGKSMNGMQIGNDHLPTATYFYILYLNNGNEPITGSIFLNN